MRYISLGPMRFTVVVLRNDCDILHGGQTDNGFLECDLSICKYSIARRISSAIFLASIFLNPIIAIILFFFFADASTLDLTRRLYTDGGFPTMVIHSERADFFPTFLQRL